MDDVTRFFFESISICTHPVENIVLKQAPNKTMTVTATEKKLVELYREADSDTKKSVMNLLKGVEDESSAILSNFLSEAINLFTSKKELPSKEILLK